MTERSQIWQGGGALPVVGDSGPYSAEDWDNQYNSLTGTDAIGMPGGVIRTSGPYLDPDPRYLGLTGDGAGFDALAVVQSNVANNQVIVLPGRAIVSGKWYENDDYYTITITDNPGGNPRIDTIILRAEWRAAMPTPQQTVRLYTLPGTPAVAPVPATLTDIPGTVVEIPIAYINIPAGAVPPVISLSEIEDGRTWAFEANRLTIDVTISPFHTTWAQQMHVGELIYLDMFTNGGAVWGLDCYKDMAGVSPSASRFLLGVIEASWQKEATGTTYAYRIVTKGICRVKTSTAPWRGSILIPGSGANGNVADLAVTYGNTGGGTGTFTFPGWSAIATRHAFGVVITPIGTTPLCYIDCQQHGFVDVPVLPHSVLQYIVAQNTPGGASAATTWNLVPLNTIHHNEIPGMGLNANVISLPAGRYHVSGFAFHWNAAGSSLMKAAIERVSDNFRWYGMNTFATLGAAGYAHIDTVIETAVAWPAGFQFRFLLYTQQAQAGNGLGFPLNLAGVSEHYASLTITKLI